jgi:hypothetical protein
LIFKTTKNIFNDLSEVFEENWIDSLTIITPEKKIWDYKRDLKIEDIEVWEVLHEQSGGIGIYAAWLPYAEFYMIRVGWFLEAQGYGVEIYYGPGSMNKVLQRASEMGITLSKNKIWVEPDDMWLYEN